MNELLQNATEILNSYSLIDVFDLENQFDYKYSMGSSTLEIQPYYHLNKKGAKLGKILVPSELIGSDIDNAYLTSLIISEVLNFIKDRGLQDDKIDYVSSLLETCLDLSDVDQNQIHQWLNVIMGGEFMDITNGEDRRWVRILSTLIIAYVIDGTTLDDESIFETRHVLKLPIEYRQVRQNPDEPNVSAPRVQYIRNLLKPGNNIFKFEVLKFQFTTYFQSADYSPLVMGNEAPLQSDKYYVSITNPLVSKYIGRVMCLPVVFQSDLVDMNRRVSVPLVEIPDLYTDSKGNQVPGFVDCRQIKNINVIAFNSKVTNNLKGDRLLIGRPQRDTINRYVDEMLGFGNKKQKINAFDPKLSESGDKCSDEFTFDKDRFKLNFVYITRGFFDRPVINKNGEYVYQTLAISNDFVVLETKVSQYLYYTLNQIMNPQKSKSNCSDDIAITGISWLEAANFCNQLSLLVGLEPAYTFVVKDKVTDQDIPTYLISPDMWNSTIFTRGSVSNKNGYRLPTEAEWEFITLAGLESDNELGGVYANENDMLKYIDLPNNNAKDVRLYDKLPNAWGLYGLLAGHGEYCFDIDKADVYNVTNIQYKKVQTHPIASGSPLEEGIHNPPRVVKGYNPPYIKNIQDISLFNRHSVDRTQNNGHKIGFRICRNIR
jgi:hypothetical protein